MARRAKSNQVIFGVFPSLATFVDVMNMQDSLPIAAAFLAFVLVSFKDLFSQNVPECTLFDPLLK